MMMKSLGKTERHFGCNSNDWNERVREMLSDRGDLLLWGKKNGSRKNKGKIPA